MSVLSPISIEACVKKLSSQITVDVNAEYGYEAPECELWRGLATAVLSSQVVYETAVAFSNALRDTDYLPPIWNETDTEYLRDGICSVLGSPLPVNGRLVRYRFPNRRGTQLSTTIGRFNEQALTLTHLFHGWSREEELRDCLIDLVDGMGPKQASMYIRDMCCVSNLAIIDTHVFDYMVLMNLVDDRSPSSIDRQSYYLIEGEFRRYAQYLNIPVHILDRSIWATMRVLKKERMN